MSFKWIVVLSVFTTMILASCTSEKSNECITSLDCEDGLVCEDGVCVEGTSNTDTDSRIENDSDVTTIPDNSSDLPDNTNTQPDDTVVDNEPVDEQQVDDVEVKDEEDDVDVVDPDDQEETDDSEVTDEVDEEVADEDNFVPTPCNPNPCEEISMSDGTCTIQGTGFKCGCETGYYWSQGECKDLNECLDSFYNDCDENADCINSTGSYSCECHINYSGDGTECTADTRDTACTNLKPDHSVWNAANADGMISQTWNGTAWDPADDTCLWDCEEHYSVNGDVCDPEVITFECEKRPANGTEWNTVASYERTWNGTEFEPAETVTEYNETPSTTACRYKCAENYEWNGTECVSQIHIFKCYTKPLIGTEWNTVSSYEQTWDGTKWVPVATTTEYNETPSETACRYICAENYSWNGSMCVAATRTFDCDAKPDTGTLWNTVSSYEQTWNGTGWFPADTTTEYNETASATACRYICAENYTWNGTICEADTKTFTCADKPATGTQWNTVASYTQTWSGTEWLPAESVTEYNTEASNEACRYQCAANYTWNGTTCEADTRTFTCADKPATGTDWNTVSSYTQTWNGTEWLPADSTTAYNTEASGEACRFKCTTNYEWNGTACVGATRTFNCPEKPGTGTEWNTVGSYEQTWSGTEWLPADTATEYNTTPSTTACRYQCLTNFTWNGSECTGTIREDQACTGLPANASWNTVSSIDQSWDGSAWVPSTTGVYNTVASTTECRFICDTNYTWNGSVCEADTQTHTCPAKPATGTEWNTVSSYTQTWNGSAWSPAADNTTEYNTTASTTSCPFKCATEYTWNGSECEVNSRTFNCAAKPATGTVWNTVSSYTQTWNGSTWLPADSTTSYNETASTTSCRYKCADGYGWTGTECVAHNCTTDADCTDVNKPVCDTSLQIYECVMCTEDADCNSEVGEKCDLSISECWSGYTCQHYIWSLPNGGYYDWDDGNQDWTTTTYWNRNTYRARSGSYSFGYDDIYDDDWDQTSRISGGHDMSACSSCSVQATFYYMGYVESTSSDFDYIQARCSGNGGSSWSNDSTLKTQTWSDWSERIWTLPSGCLTSNFTFGMRFYSDYSYVEDGMVIDDLSFSPVSTNPVGNFDGITDGPGSYLWGWTCDGDDYSKDLLIHLAFYKDGNLSGDPVVKWIRAGTTREQAVGDICGGDSTHGFWYALEDDIVTQLGSGTHTLYAYAVEVGGSSGTCGGRFFSFPNIPATFTLP